MGIVVRTVRCHMELISAKIGSQSHEEIIIYLKVARAVAITGDVGTSLPVASPMTTAVRLSCIPIKSWKSH